MQQIGELNNLLKEVNIDKMLICEARVSPYSSFRIPDYSTYQCEHSDKIEHSVIILK